MKISLRKSGGVVVLALLLTMAMSITAFAGTITINNSLENSTYNAYKIFDVTYSGTGSTSTYANYSYTISSDTSSSNTTSEWFSVVAKYANGGTDYTSSGSEAVGATIPTSGTSTNGLTLTKNSEGTWNVSFDNDSTNEITDFSAETFAEYLKTNTPQSATAAATGTGTGGTISLADSNNSTDNLSAGYYFVTSSLGALCMLNTADDSVTINEKNTFPQINKAAGEYTASYDSTNSRYTVNAPANTTKSASVGDTVNYEIIVQAGKGATGDYYIMDYGKGLATVDADTNSTSTNKITSVQCLDSTGNWQNITYETVTTDPTISTTIPTGQIKLFTIKIANSEISGFADGQPIRVRYTTTVTSDSIDADSTGTIGNAANTAILVEKVDDETTNVTEESVSTNVENYDFDIFKYTGSATPLENAEFNILDSSGNTLKFLKDSTNDYYYYLSSDATASETVTSDSNGLIHIKGLAGNKTSSDTTGTKYYIKETKAPAGYNLMTSTKDITLKDADQLYTAGDSGALGSGGVQIVNNTGSEIPSTGGMGTTIFYILGGALIVVAGVLLIVRKRTNA